MVQVLHMRPLVEGFRHDIHWAVGAELLWLSLVSTRNITSMHDL